MGPLTIDQENDIRNLYEGFRIGSTSTLDFFLDWLFEGSTQDGDFYIGAGDSTAPPTAALYIIFDTPNGPLIQIKGPTTFVSPLTVNDDLIIGGTGVLKPQNNVNVKTGKSIYFDDAAANVHVEYNSGTKVMNIQNAVSGGAIQLNGGKIGLFGEAPAGQATVTLADPTDLPTALAQIIEIKAALGDAATGIGAFHLG
jgi:hypothetical protein